MTPTRTLHWFRNDLRLDDNPALAKALRSDETVTVVVLDDGFWDEDRWGHVKTGPFRTRFLLESIADLKTALEERGGALLIRRGMPEDILPALMTQHACTQLTAQAEHTPEELEIEAAVERAVRTQGDACSWVEGHTLYHPDDLPMDLDALPDIFTQFRKKVEKLSEVRECIPAPTRLTTPEGLTSDKVPDLDEFLASTGQTMPPVDSRSVLPFKGGASEARARLKHYFWDTKRLAAYKKTRNGLVGADYSSKFSPWLAHGCISPRRIASEVYRFEDSVEANDSTYWLVFELIWRDYFRFVAMKYGSRIFHRKALKPDSANRGTQRPAFEAWKEGRTRDAFVNANMKELARTGFMSNRGRQNVASYLVHDLGIDWRLGASWFEHMLLDYDPASNAGNWIYVSGVGNDPRPNRKFNTQRQAEMYDGDGTYQTLWSTDALELDVR
ncbi:MAG: DASH family cryptochrome [Flavobacteriales bacterium]|nr:DASH family cryptochrome [Flavobacteriales bacterium]